MTGINRRTTLKGLAAGAALPLLDACRGRPLSVLVIGAGIAGLTAARALAEAGHRPVIAEARSRIGGRVWTSRAWPDLPADLGASWIHGLKANPVTALAREAGAATFETSYDNAALHIDPALRALGVKTAATGWAEDLTEAALAYAAKQPADLSVRAAIDAVSPPARRSPAEAAQLAFHLASTFEQEFGGDLAALSARTVEESGVFEGPDVLFPGGYDQLTAHLALGLDVRLGQAVTELAWSEAGVTATFADGDRHTADRAIVTLPLGVLKAGGVRFVPDLPAAKQAAIARLGMGLLNKHFLRFDRVFWPPEFDWHEYLHDTPGDWAQWVSLARLGGPPCLLGFTGAAAAREMETRTDADILADATAALRRMFGSSVPGPAAGQVTRWSRDPFALGAYSFNAVGSAAADRLALAAPEAGGVLQLAGEATHETYPGTVHGALLSGRRAAIAAMS